MLDNIYLASFVVFVSQIAFVYLRTINVIYTADRNLWGSVITGNGIGLTWLIVTSIGVSSVLKGEFIPIIFFLLGGSIGNYIAIKQKQNKG